MAGLTDSILRTLLDVMMVYEYHWKIANWSIYVEIDLPDIQYEILCVSHKNDCNNLLNSIIQTVVNKCQ